MTGTQKESTMTQPTPKDRLLRVGTKYQAIAPSVADGDNVHLL